MTAVCAVLALTGAAILPSNPVSGPPPFFRGRDNARSHYNHGLSFVSDAAEAGNGFASPQQTLFAPVLALAPPGPNQAARALAAINRSIPFFRRVLFHPQFDPALERLIELMPPRESTLIRAAALYANPAIPWQREADGTHAIAIDGRERDGAFVFSLVPTYAEPAAPFDFAGLFALTPSASGASLSSRSMPLTLIGRLAGDASLESFGLGALINASALSLREIYGDLEQPWDKRQGEFNGHDRALLARLKANAPKFSARLAHYFIVDNVLDEFSTAAGALALVNIDARVRDEALRPYPDLRRFYSRFAPRVLIDSTIVDQHGNRWIAARLDHGRISLQLAVRAGMLASLKAQLNGASSPIALDQITRGHWRSITTITLDKFRTTFGLKNIAFTTNYWRIGERVELNSQMDSVPQLIAPPVVNGLVRLMAGEFLQGLARGHGGMTISFQSERDARGVFHVGGALSGELRYSPMLAMLADIGDAIADAHNVKVRDDERRLGQELFDALVDDYHGAGRQILSLDTLPKANSNP